MFFHWTVTRFAIQKILEILLEKCKAQALAAFLTTSSGMED
jgi:hypothetical protein